MEIYNATHLSFKQISDDQVRIEIQLSKDLVDYVIYYIDYCYAIKSHYLY